jgi:F-type H+-transporting ATPase subunit gamma
MANLKDIRTRINSVKTTRQVTSAMKMVSAAKLKKAHDEVTNIQPYVEKMSHMIYDLVNSCTDDIDSELTEVREPDNVLIVAIASNRGLCGAFNSNVVKKTEELITKQFSAQYKNKALKLMVIGKQAEKMLRQHGFSADFVHNDYYDDPSFDAATAIAESFMQDFKTKKYDRVIIVYNEFINAVNQTIRAEQLLPIEMPVNKEDATVHNYIFEPDPKSIIRALIPQALKTLFFKMLLDSIASEHGARMTSMHKATDNATELINDLELEYNKARQGAITKEILEIVSGAEALKSS